MSVVDDWSEKIENGEDMAIIVIDQSAAYDTIDHPILLEKMEAVGFNNSTLNYFKSYLKDRRQSIHMEGDVSDELYIGNMSVIQGSTLSCLLYLLYTLDLPLLFYNSKLTIKQQNSNKEPTSTTYVDDTTTTITLNKDDLYQNQINNTVNKLMDYMNANLLTMNQDKTQLMIITKNLNIKDKLQINTPTKTILPTNSFKYLGIMIKDDLKWNLHIKDSKEALIKQMTTRINSIKLLKRNLDTNTLTKIATGLIYSKMLYGMEIWGSAPDYLTKQINTTLMKAARVVAGIKSYRWSNNRTLQELGWLNTQQQITLTSAKVGHKLLHRNIPENIAYKINRDKTDALTRMSGPNKMGPRLRGYGGGVYTKYQMRSKLYLQYDKIPESIQNMKDPYRFKKWTKKYLLNPGIKLPQESKPKSK